MPAIEGREQVEARDETLGVKADAEARRRFGALSVLEPAGEVPIGPSHFTERTGGFWMRLPAMKRWKTDF
jgi:hypothetical protein